MKDRIIPVLRIFDEAKAREFYSKDMGIDDPFGNQLVFVETLP